MTDAGIDVADVRLEIVFPDQPSDDLHADVFDCLGMVPDVKGPDRDLGDASVILVFLAGWSSDLFRDRFGNAAWEKASRFLKTVLNHGRTPKGVPRSPEDREMRLVVGARQGVTFVVDDEVADDPRAVVEMLEIDVAAHADGTTLRWHPAAGSWLP